MITVLLVDDQAIVRRALRARFALEPDIDVLDDEAGDGVEALRLTSTLAPDVVLMDVAMPRLDGIGATAAIHAGMSRSAVVVLSLDDSAATHARAMAAGAAAVIGKHEPPESLLDAIRQAAGEHRTPHR
jgi:DNA-binding NarL/FixJ family response regulator